MLAVSLLALCLVNADSMVALQRSGCLQQLLGHITDSTSTEMKRNAVRREEGRKEEGRKEEGREKGRKEEGREKGRKEEGRNGSCKHLEYV